MNKKTFSEKTQKRLDILEQLLINYEESIEWLNQFAEGRLTLKSKNYTFGAEPYERTPPDEQRFVFTMHPLKDQIGFYQHELEVLQE